MFLFFYYSLNCWAISGYIDIGEAKMTKTQDLSSSSSNHLWRHNRRYGDPCSCIATHRKLPSLKMGRILRRFSKSIYKSLLSIHSPNHLAKSLKWETWFNQDLPQEVVWVVQMQSNHNCCGLSVWLP